ncbi:colicin transporter [Leisingera sp. McT4-56]|uniref:colicin transporter n=1 Tax=Leisingera sp. McT4-56 TaxID=2881255 RepID=UPI001CF8F1C3|nr:colicin transporter [Leisingera sp. McT4-56]MCB4454051.1 colicin transporter [Leisingera sp. McT4-56]
MNQIEELQGRIQAALERISAGTAALQEARAADKARAEDAAAEAAKAAESAAAGAANAELEQALDEERTANAQLEERVKVLHARLKEAESSAPAGTASDEDVAAMQAELELLRNEAGDPAEKQALRAEVARLKGELEVAANNAANAREALEDQLAEAQAANDTLKAQLAAADSGDGAGSPGMQDTAAELARQNDALVQLDAELQELRMANEELRASNTALREANAQSLGDAGLINASMEAEIQGLRAAQASDQAQVNAVLAKLEPLLANARNLPEGEEV